MLIEAYVIKIFMHFMETGYAVEQLVKALRYTLEGSWFDSRWSHWGVSNDLILPAALCL